MKKETTTRQSLSDLIDDILETASPGYEEEDSLLRLLASVDELRRESFAFMPTMTIGTTRLHRQGPTSDPFEILEKWVDLPHLFEILDRPEDFDPWVRHHHPTVRLMLAKSPHCPPECLAILAQEPWEEIRLAVLANPQITQKIRNYFIKNDPLEWLREAAADPKTPLSGRCALDGGKIKRPDRFLTCSIACSYQQANQRLDSGLYSSTSGPFGEFTWEVAASRSASGGIPGTGPNWRRVHISPVYGWLPDQVTSARFALSDKHGTSYDAAIELLQKLVTQKNCSYEEFCASL